MVESERKKNIRRNVDKGSLQRVCDVIINENTRTGNCIAFSSYSAVSMFVQYNKHARGITPGSLHKDYPFFQMEQKCNFGTGRLLLFNGLAQVANIPD